MIDPFSLGLILFAIYGVFALLIAFEKLNILIALPVLAMIMALIVGTPPVEAFNIIISQGALSYASVVIIIIFGGVLAQAVFKTGIGQNIIKRAAELGGDRPFSMAIALSFATAFIHIAIFSTGLTIMSGVIVLPIMLQVGVPPAVAVGTFLFGVSLGYTLNVVAYSLYAPILNYIPEEMFRNLLPVAISWAVITIIIGVFGYTIYNFRKSGIRIRWGAKTPGLSTTDVPEAADLEKIPKVPIYSLLTPIIPIILVLLGLDIISSLLVGIIYAILSTHISSGRSWKEDGELFVKSMYDAFPDIAHVTALWMTVGMLIKASGVVREPMGAVLTAIMPQNPLAFFGFMGGVAPLAMFRGPFNMTGLGAGIIRSFLDTGLLTNSAILVSYLSVLTFLYVSCPTGSWILWSCLYAKVPPTENLRKTFLFSWAVGLTIMAVGAWFVLNGLIPPTAAPAG
jgi:H+/gluconate symporter-like permease